MGQVIVRRSGSGTGYSATEWQWDRLYCDGVAVGQVIVRQSGSGTGYSATEWQWDRLY